MTAALIILAMIAIPSVAIALVRLFAWLVLGQPPEPYRRPRR